MALKQTAGRKELGEFAPKFAELNDDVLFGEVWSREDKLSLRDRSLVAVTSLMSQGLIDSSFRHHLESAKKNGITKKRRNYGDFNAQCFLCRMAQSLDCISYSKRSLG